MQMLMVGGPAHGQIVNINVPSPMLMERGNVRFQYNNHTYVMYGKIYMLGLCNPDEDQFDGIPDLIVSSQVECFKILGA